MGEKISRKSAVAHKWADWLHNLGGPPTLHSGGQNQRGTKSAVARKWADWLHNPCGLGGHQHFKAGDKISSGLQVGIGSIISVPKLRSRGQNQQWSTYGLIGYITPAIWGGPQRFRAGESFFVFWGKLRFFKNA